MRTCTGSRKRASTVPTTTPRPSTLTTRARALEAAAKPAPRAAARVSLHRGSTAPRVLRGGFRTELAFTTTVACRAIMGRTPMTRTGRWSASYAQRVRMRRTEVRRRARVALQVDSRTTRAKAAPASNAASESRQTTCPASPSVFVALHGIPRRDPNLLSIR